MGIITTESFARFARGKFDFSAGTSGLARPIQADTEWREITGYAAVADAQNGAFYANDDIGIGIVQDPIVASKNRLCMDSIVVPANTKIGAGHTYCLEKLFSTPKTKFQVGFLCRFPTGQYTKDNPASTTVMGYGIELCAAGRSRSNNSAAQPRYATVAGASGAAAHSVVSIDTFGVPGTPMPTLTTVVNNGSTTPTFRIKGTTDPNGAGIALKMDTDIFVEVEVDTTNQTLRIWVDDVYAGTSAWSASGSGDAPFTNGFQIRLYRGGTTNYAVTTDLGGVMLSDVYCLDLSDGVVPNTRLGKSTRVMGEAPDADVSTMFSRPDGFAGNYDVVNDPIASNSAPTVYLTGEGEGTEDLYRTAGSNIGSFAGTVYGVVLRARYQNASGSAHTLAITSSDGTTKTENSLGSVAAGTGVLMKSVVLNKAPDNSAWTPAKAAALRYGFKIVN